MSLTTLPLLPLEEIASYLDFNSLASLAASTSSLAHLQPKEQLVKGEDFSMAGRSYRDSEERNYTPEPYFDVAVNTRGLLGIKMVWEWRGKVSRRNIENVQGFFLDEISSTYPQSLKLVSMGCTRSIGTRSGYFHSTKAQVWLQLVREDKVSPGIF